MNDCLIDWMKNHGHYLDSSHPVEEYIRSEFHSEQFSIDRLVRITLLSFLAAMRPTNFYTDGKLIFVSDTYHSSSSTYRPDDYIRQTYIDDVLDGNVQSKLTGPHAAEAYARLGKDWQRFPLQQIIENEGERVGARIMRTNQSLTEFLGVVEKLSPAYAAYVQALRERLATFSPRPVSAAEKQ